MRPRKLEDAKPVCAVCKKGMEPVKLKIGEIDARAWRCPKCAQEIIHPEDAQLALIMAQLKKGVDIKVGTLNDAPYVRFPKDFGHIIQKGDIITVFMEAADEIRLKVKHSETLLSD
jgi:hypothetical protein